MKATDMETVDQAPALAITIELWPKGNRDHRRVVLSHYKIHADTLVKLLEALVDEESQRRIAEVRTM